MSREEMIADVRAACIKANPEIGKLLQPFAEGFFLPKDDKDFTGASATEVVLYQQTRSQVLRKLRFERPIRLADVLLGIEGKRPSIKTPHGIQAERDAWFEGTLVSIVYGWNLRQDDLTLQSDECLAFLHSLL